MNTRSDDPAGRSTIRRGRVVLFAHSLVSDWSHGNAHFLRGLLRALRHRGHEVLGCEPWQSWAVTSLYEEHGVHPLLEFGRVYGDLEVHAYRGGRSILDEAELLTRGADIVLVHEFNEPELVGAVGHVRHRRGDFVLLFYDSHHRAVTVPEQLARFNLRHYDGVLAYGESLAEVYRRDFGHRRVWTFHEAADTTVFRPLDRPKTQDVIWIGNWGDDERTAEIRDYLVGPARMLPELSFAVHGVRYPEAGLREIEDAGIDFRGWIPNFRVPEAFARSKMTVHIPRGPYLDRLPGIPTIRPFEALGCGVPLLSTYWEDREGLFRPGVDYLMVHSPGEMREQMLRLAREEETRLRLGENGLETIRARHTCDHRAEQLESIAEGVGAAG